MNADATSSQQAERDSQSSDPTIGSGQLERKDVWDKMQIVTVATVPFVIALFGWMFNSTLKNREVDAQYVNLAIQVLQSTDTAEVTEQLRIWAGDILDELGPVPMPEGLRGAISAGAIQLPNVSANLTLTRLDIDLSTDMIVTLDNVRKQGPGLSGWITRVSPGIHEVVWLTSDSTPMCSYRRIFGDSEDVTLRCDRETGHVAAEISKH